jgi:hydroxymethylglutaryl-CoA synthase
MTGIESYGVALPTLRLPASAYIKAWGSCAARGLKQKAFCAYDEDPVTLAIGAARQALKRLPASVEIGALFFGVTTPPFEEKPSAATLPTALFENSAIRVTEITGSPQAGIHALVSTVEYCMAGEGRYGLAIAADAPSGPPDSNVEHALGAAAAAFVVGPDGGVANFENSFSVTHETFGSRFRRHGEDTLSDLELRTRDNLESVKALSIKMSLSQLGEVKYLALGTDAGLIRGAGKALKLPQAKIDALWSMIGDAGSASAPFALADALDVASDGERILCAGIGSGATAALLTAGKNLYKIRRKGLKVRDLVAGGKVVDYITYLKHRRMLSSQFGGNG